MPAGKAVSYHKSLIGTTLSKVASQTKSQKSATWVLIVAETA